MKLNFNFVKKSNMELQEIIKPLSIEEIDFRIQSVNAGGYATILAYKDARADMNRLDKAFSVFGWQKKYELIDGNLFCHVGILNPDSKEWIWKCDVGTESQAEKEKGQASDAFKRACFNIGIGRELYDYPLIQVKLKDNEWVKETKKTTFNLKLKDWKWFSQFEDNKLTYLGCKDEKGELRFSYGTIKK